MELSENVLNMFHVSLDIVLYDPTNFYTFIEDHDGNELPHTGYSKDHRADLNLINVALFCTREFGIPIKHETYAGNETDVTHFKGVIQPFIDRMLRFHHDVEDITIVFDKGNNNFQALKIRWGNISTSMLHLRWVKKVTPAKRRRGESWKKC